jgi:DNA-binding beta-propeller fold protein YncE
VQAATRRAALVHSTAGTVEILDLADPARPRSLRVVDLGLAKKEELTSVALPPRGDWFLVAVKADGALVRGRVVAHALDDGRRLATFPCGVGPDSVAIDASGRFALVANEAEGFARVDGELRSAPGSLTRIALAEDVARSVATDIALEGLLDEPAAGRLLERRVGGETIAIPLGTTSEFWEPECVAFLPDGTHALVTLQESNAVARIDVAGGRCERLFGLGTTSHLVDAIDDDQFEERGILLARREPDGIAVTPDGRYFVTADEGDTLPDVPQTPQDSPAGGARSLSVFDAATGALVGDTGPQLDRAAASMGLHTDRRSPRRGCEPEMVVVLDLGGTLYAAVTLERVGAVALIDLSKPETPTLVALSQAGDNPWKDEPEGLAHFRDPSGGDYLYVANEGKSTLGVLRVGK